MTCSPSPHEAPACSQKARVRVLPFGRSIKTGMLSGLEDLRSLTKLNLGNCSSLKEVAVLKELPALRELGIWGCSSLTDLDVLKE